MLFNANDIDLSNYEEYFILYMDNELNAGERSRVERFISLYPHLAEELNRLMSTKLPDDTISFHHKEALRAVAMQLNFAEEELLLYVDGELPDAKKTLVEENISTNKEYARQYALLLKAKLDAAEMISYPDKKELYRHTEKVVHFGVWLRVAVAIVILLLGSLFLLTNSGKTGADHLVNNEPAHPSIKKNRLPEQNNRLLPQQKEVPVVVKTSEVKKGSPVNVNKKLTHDTNQRQVTNAKDVAGTNDLPRVKREIIQFDTPRFTTEINSTTVGINKTIGYTPVTSKRDSAYNIQNNPVSNPEAEWAVETEKKTRAKGFLRKVSRFIQRNTGIGTVNADNELLVGVVALKLK